MVEKMIAIRWIISSILIAFGLCVGVSQWMAISSASRREKNNPDFRGISLIPVIGGLAGAIGCLLSPSPTIRMLWWIPPIIDPGCVLMHSLLVGSITYGLFQRIFNRS